MEEKTYITACKNLINKNRPMITDYELRDRINKYSKKKKQKKIQYNIDNVDIIKHKQLQKKINTAIVRKRKRRERDIKNKDKIKETKKQYYIKNKERLLEYNREWYKNKRVQQQNR